MTSASDAARRAGLWLNSAAQSIPTGDLTLALQASVAAAICGDLGGDRVTAEPLFRMIEGSSLEELERCNPILTLLSCLSMERRGTPLGSVIGAYLDAINLIVLEDQQAQYPGAALLLRQLGHAQQPHPPHDEAVDARNLLSGASTDVRSGLNAIETATEYGTRAIGCLPGSVEVLAAIAIDRLRAYDFDLATRAIRACRYLGGGNPVWERVVTRFLLLNQDIDGSFGFFELEIKELRRTTDTGVASLRFKIPATLATSWTLAESYLSDYRVIRDIGTHHDRAR